MKVTLSIRHNKHWRRIPLDTIIMIGPITSSSIASASRCLFRRRHFIPKFDLTKKCFRVCAFMSTDGGVGAIHFGDYCISPWRKDKDAGYHFVVVVAVVVIVVVVVVVLFW
jgi:hypothetical protein